jgi:hypothetical protein
MLTLVTSRASKTTLGSAVAFFSVLAIAADFHLAALVFTLILLGFSKSAKSELPLIQVMIGLYLYLFVFRFLVLSMYKVTPKLGRLEISLEDMRNMLLLISYETLVIILVFRAVKSTKQENPARKILSDWLTSRNASLILNILFLCTLTGFVLMLFTTGSLVTLVDVLFSHRKISVTQEPMWQLGLTLWSLFCTPFLTLSLLRHLKLQNTGIFRVFPIQALLILAILLFVFGGRLGIVISFVIAFSLSKHLGFYFRKSWYLLGAACALVFLLIGNARTETVNDFFDLKKTLISATYPVLDAAALASGSPSDIPAQLRSGDRFSAYAVSFIPRFLWPEKPLLTSMTLDTQIAQVFGYENQRGVTGWPSGFATEPYLIGGVYGVFIYAVLLGLLLKLVVMRLNSRNTSRLEGNEFVARFCLFYFLIAIMKDGDTLAAIQSGIRLFIWLNVLLVMVRFWQKISQKGV